MDRDPPAEMIPPLLDLVALGAMSGYGASLVDLHRRLNAVLEEPTAHLSTRERVLAEIEIERRGWEEGLLEILLPDVRTELAQELPSDRLAAGLAGVHDPWASLDGTETRPVDIARRFRLELIRYAVIHECGLFLRTKKATHLREAVRQIEEEMRRGASTGFVLTEETFETEAECLHGALREVLGNSASCFATWGVRQYIETIRPSARNPSGGYKSQTLKDDHWLSRERWTNVEPWEQWDEGVWFIPEVQEVYDEKRREAEREYERSIWKQARDRSEASRGASVGGNNLDDSGHLADESSSDGSGDRSVTAVPSDAMDEPQKQARRDGEPALASLSKALQSGSHVVIHFVQGGFTAFGTVWGRGMELWLDRNSPAWDLTLDADGKSWVDETEEDQKRTRGKVYFRQGLWPGQPPGIATVSADGIVERPSDQKKHPISMSWEENDGY